jgi:predicted ester cyclase
VVVEFWLRGTHKGDFRGVPPTGKSFECKMAAFFFFEDERLVCERVYFDAATILTQLGLVGA